MPVHTLSLGPLGTNCLVIMHPKGDALVVDPGGTKAEELDQILMLLASHKAKVQAIVCTHLHFDHTAGVAALHKATGAPIFASELDLPLFDNGFGAGGMWGFPLVERFTPQPLLPGPRTFGAITCEVKATPGHTPGSLSLYLPDEGAFVGGDLIFFRSIGRSDFPGGDQDVLLESIRREVLPLPPQTRIYPGHGADTSVEAEKTHNPFLKNL